MSRGQPQPRDARTPSPSVLGEARDAATREAEHEAPEGAEVAAAEVGIVLYGPPASGKDTITDALIRLDPRCQHFPRLKVGPGRRVGYRMTTFAELDRLDAAGDLAWRNQRYSATYAIDTPELRTRLDEHMPVLHLGQPEAIDAVTAATPNADWLVVALWCPREVAAQRLTDRDPTDVAARLAVWDATPPLPAPDLAIDTGATAPSDASGEILARLPASPGSGGPVSTTGGEAPWPNAQTR